MHLFVFWHKSLLARFCSVGVEELFQLAAKRGDQSSALRAAVDLLQKNATEEARDLLEAAKRQEESGGKWLVGVVGWLGGWLHNLFNTQLLHNLFNTKSNVEINVA